MFVKDHVLNVIPVIARNKMKTTTRRNVVLTFRVSASEAREYRLLARAERRTTSEMIRRAVEDRLEHSTARPGDTR